MNTIRMIAVALPMTILIACGGGGGGTAAAPTTPPTTMMPGTGGPNMPPGTNDPNTPPTNMPPTVTLPGYAVTAADARTRVGGTAPTAANTMSETAIVTEIQRIATAADTFEFSDFGPTASAVTVTCSNKSCTTGNIADVGTLTFSLAGIDDLSLVDETGLVGFNSNTEAVMVDRNGSGPANRGGPADPVTMIQSQAATGQNDGTHLAFQTYGGWLTGSVFGVESFVVTENGTDTNRFASFSFGNNSGSNPTGSAELFWDGIMVGAVTGTVSGTNNTSVGDIIHGDVSIQHFTRTANSLDTLTLSSVKNLNTGEDINFNNQVILQWENIPLSDGAFELDRSGLYVKGNFYGSSHEEVGGILERSGSYNFVGAFGGTKR